MYCYILLGRVLIAYNKCTVVVEGRRGKKNHFGRIIISNLYRSVGVRSECFETFDYYFSPR